MAHLEYLLSTKVEGKTYQSSFYGFNMGQTLLHFRPFPMQWQILVVIGKSMDWNLGPPDRSHRRIQWAMAPQISLFCCYSGLKCWSQTRSLSTKWWSTGSQTFSWELPMATRQSSVFQVCIDWFLPSITYKQSDVPIWSDWLCRSHSVIPSLNLFLRVKNIVFKTVLSFKAGRL